MNTKIFTRWLCVCSACRFILSCFLFRFYKFVNVTTTKTVNFDEWFESLALLESFISILVKFWIKMGRLINQICFEWYEFDVKVATHCNLQLISRRCSEYECQSEYIVKFQYCWLHECSWVAKNDALLISASLRNALTTSYKKDRLDPDTNFIEI